MNQNNNNSTRQQWRNPETQQWVDSASHLIADIALARTEMYSFDYSGLDGYDGLNERALLVMAEIAEALPKAFPPGWFDEVMSEVKRQSHEKSGSTTPNAPPNNCKISDKFHNQGLQQKQRKHWLGPGKQVTEEIVRYLGEREGQHPDVTEHYLPGIANAVAARLAQFLSANNQLRILHNHLRPKASGRSRSRKAQLKPRPPKGNSHA